MEQEQLLKLVEMAAEGDAQAFEEICRHKAKDVLYICAKLMGNLQDGEDAAQEVFIAMQTSIGRLEKPVAFTAWSNRLIANTCKSMLRKRRRHNNIALGAFAPSMEEMNMEFLPQEFAEEQDKQRIVLEAMEELPFQYRAALLLFYYENLPAKEIAQSLGTNTKGANNLLSRGRKALRRGVERRMGGSVRTVLRAGYIPVLTRVLQSDALQSLTEESVGRVQAVGAAGTAAGTAATSVSSGAITTASVTAASGASLGALGWATVAAMSVTAVVVAAAITIGASSASPGSYTVQAPPASAVQDLNTTGDAGGANIETGESLPEEEEKDEGRSGEEEPVMESPPAAGGGEEGIGEGQAVAGESVTVMYYGQLRFVGAGNVPMDGYNHTARGFAVQVYGGGTLLASVTANESGAFSFTLQNPPARLLVVAEPKAGYGAAAGHSLTIEVASHSSNLPPLYFTDTAAPTGTLTFYDAGDQPQGDTNPAYARLEVQDATETAASWQVLDGTNQILASGAGTVVPLASTGLYPPGQYTLVYRVTDAAGNTTVLETGFSIL